MVVQYDGFTPPPIEAVMASVEAMLAAEAAGAAPPLPTSCMSVEMTDATAGAGAAVGAAAATAAAAAGALPTPAVRILGISKLKCLNYLIRTFGVRNQLGTLLERGPAAYLASTERFLKIWGVPAALHAELTATFTSWTREVALLGEGEKRTLRGGEYLALLEPFLAGERRAAPADTFGLDRFLVLIVNLTGAPLPPTAMREYAPGLQPCAMHEAAQLARAGSVMLLEQPPSGRQFQTTAGTPTLILLFPPPAGAEPKWHKMAAACLALEARHPQLAGRVLTAPPVAEWRAAVTSMAAALPPSASELLAARMGAAVAAAAAAHGGAPPTSRASQLLAAPALAPAPAVPERPVRTVVVLCALPPGGGKSTFYNALREAGAAVVSSDEEKARGGKFDAVLATALQSQPVVCYDKNVPNIEGFSKVVRVLSSIAKDRRLAVRVLVVVPSHLEHDVAWARVQARPPSHNALNVHTPTGGAQEAYGIFKTIFFDACQAFQPQAAALPAALVSGAFWEDLDATRALAATAFERVADAPALADLKTAVESVAGGVPTGGGGGCAWACAEIPATKLHVTLVPPAYGGDRATERERAAAVRRFRPLASQGVRLHVLRYIFARSRAFVGAAPTPAKSTKGHGRESAPTERRVGFWEVGAIDGLPEEAHYAQQREVYHITDTASLVGTAPRDAAEILRALRHGDVMAAEWDVSGMGETTPCDVFAQVKIVS